MATERKFLTLDKLNLYDDKLKAKMAQDDAAVLSQAKEYADGLGVNYETAGSAATAKAEAIAAAKTETTNQVKALADGQVAKNAAAIEELETTFTAELDKKQPKGDYATKTEAKGYADAKDTAISAAQAAADAAQADATKNASAIEAINHETTGILAQAKSYAGEEDAKLQGNIDTLVGKVGTVPENQTVMGMIQKIQESAYDDSAIQAKIDGVGEKVTKLIGEDANKSVRTIANEELAAALIPEDAKDSLDTLTEIATWIQTHPDDAAAMNAAIEALQTKVDTGDKNVSTYVADAIAALSIGDYAKAADLTALAGRVEALETASETHAKQSDLDDKVKTLTAADSALGARVSTLETAIGESGSISTDIETAKNEAITTAAADATTKADKALSDAKAYSDTELNKVKTTVETNTAAIAKKASQADVDALTERVTTSEGDIDTLQASMSGVEAKASANETAIKSLQNASATHALKSDVEALTTRVAANEAGLAAFVEISEEEINQLFQ